MEDIRFSAIPLFRKLDRVELARLIPSFTRVEYREGDILFRQGDRGDSLYIVIRGQVEIVQTNRPGERSTVATLGPGDCFGEMALLSGEPRSADVIAGADLTALKLDKSSFELLLRKHPSVGTHLALMLALRFAHHPLTTDPCVPFEQRTAITTEVPASSAIIPQTTHGIFSLPRLLRHKKIIALLAATAISLGTGFYLANNGLSGPQAILSALLLAAAILWSLDVYSYHAVAVALPVLAVTFRITSAERAFSGFSSPSWFLVLGVFAMTAAIAHTGLMYRLVLGLVRRFPPSFVGQTLALALAGLLLTPVIPSSNGRAALAGPLALTISETLRFRKGSPGAIGIAMACLLGFGHMSFMFMNGTATCFLALGLLPAASRSSITWTSWLAAALPLGLTYFFLTYLALLLLYRPRNRRQGMETEVINAQLKTLGPPTAPEKISLTVVLLSLAAFITEPLHGINVAWVAMGSFLILFASDVLGEKQVRSEIDWNFLISFGALIGFGGILSASGLTDLVAQRLKPYLAIFSGSPYLFLPVVSLAIHLLRLALPLPAALLIGILSVVPISGSLGITPLVVALVVLASVNPWFFPFQNSIYLNIIQSTEGRLFSHKQARPLAWYHVLAVIAAILVAIPFWSRFGLIR